MTDYLLQHPLVTTFILAIILYMWIRFLTLKKKIPDWLLLSSGILVIIIEIYLVGLVFISMSTCCFL